MVALAGAVGELTEANRAHSEPPLVDRQQRKEVGWVLFVLFWLLSINDFLIIY